MDGSVTSNFADSNNRSQPLEPIMTKVIKAGIATVEKRKIDTEIQNTVSSIIDQIDSEGDGALRRLSAKFDKWDRQDYRLNQSEIERRRTKSLRSTCRF